MANEVADWAREAWARVRIDQGRADFLEKLYLQDGRDDKTHPFHHTYTGLYMKYAKDLETA